MVLNGLQNISNKILTKKNCKTLFRFNVEILFLVEFKSMPVTGIPQAFAQWLCENLCQGIKRPNSETDYINDDNNNNNNTCSFKASL